MQIGVSISKPILKKYVNSALKIAHYLHKYTSP